MIRPPVISVTWAPPILSHYQSPVVLQTYYAILHLACSSACYRNSSSLQLFNLLGSTTYALIPSSSKLGEQPQLECSQSNFNMHCFNCLLFYLYHRSQSSFKMCHIFLVLFLYNLEYAWQIEIQLLNFCWMNALELSFESWINKNSNWVTSF